MKISIRIDSAAAQAQLRRWGGEFRDKVKKAVAKAMAKEAVEIKQDRNLSMTMRHRCTLI